MDVQQGVMNDKLIQKSDTTFHNPTLNNNETSNSLLSNRR